MKIHTTHFDGNMEDLGIEVGNLFMEEYLNAHRKLRRHSASISEFYRPFFRGLSEITEIPVADLGGIVSSAKSKAIGGVQCLEGNFLSMRYKLAAEDELQLFYGKLDGLPFAFLSLFPYPPGTLGGLNSYGIAWASRTPNTRTLQQGELVDMGHSDWGSILGVKMTTDIILASSIPHQVVSSQPSNKHKCKPNPEAHAREAFEDTHSPEDVLIMLETKTRHITLVRGTGTEITFDILAD